MGLSRLDNFLKNSRGDILYVDPSNVDSTDSIENQGNSLTRPFKTIQRALIEAARFSYQRGLDNDRFGRTTIIVYPGEHVIDNRPGWIPIHDSPIGGNNWILRGGSTSNDFNEFNLETNFDITSSNNDLYKMNSVYGGVIIPRGTSVVGLDLRKTKIRPKFVPNPNTDNIKNTSIFRVTGSCYFYQFTIFDADPNGLVYKDYTNSTFVPNFSHHKVTAFEYADGVNPVKFDDLSLVYNTTRTDLDIYYDKIGLMYGPSSGREIAVDYPSASMDIQPKIDEFRIVGSKGQDVGITSIRAGDGVTSSSIITVNISEPISGLDVDTPIRIEGVPVSGYNGQYVISGITSTTQITYKASTVPANPLPTIVSGSPTLNIVVDTVTSSSPYIFNCSLRSVFGMCGLHADGNKANGFKSMVVAQFTGIGLQKDDNAFVKYNSSTGLYDDATSVTNIHTDSRARYKPSFENFHIKASNDAFLQLVSIFAIGYANHFVVESGADHSITNSNSNFGAKSLVARGFKNNAFTRDDTGFITHYIPPKQIESEEITIEYESVDVNTTVGVGSTTRLYLYNRTNVDDRPNYIVEGYRIGAKKGDSLHVSISNNVGVTSFLTAKIIMPNTQNTGVFESSSRKVAHVQRSALGINNIAANVLTFTTNHSFINGESIRITSLTGELPDGLNNNQIYYAIVGGALSSNQIKIAQTFNDTISGDAISINDKGGLLLIESRVSDKISGDIGHPIQYDQSIGQWYVTTSGISSYNNFYSTIIGLGTAFLGAATPRTFIKRLPDSRSLTDKIYKFRYVIPKDSVTIARPPQEGFVLQESGSTIGITNAEVVKLGSIDAVSISNSSELRNPKLISGATWNVLTNTATFTTELPHRLSIGSLVEIKNIKSTNNTSATDNTGFNGYFNITGKTSNRTFTVGITTNPGTFTNNTSVRNTSLPYLRRARLNNTFVIYKSTEIQAYIPGTKDGIYHLTVIDSSNSPTVSPFNELRFSQPVQNLYPQLDRDNSVSDADPAVSFALPDPIGLVQVNDPENSITLEAVHKSFNDFSVGVAITDITSSSGYAHTIYTSIEHGLNRISKVGIVSTGLNYGNGTGSVQTLYNALLVGFAGSTTGQYATANVKIDASGKITNVKIIDGGSSYGIGNTLAIVGVATTTSHIVGVVSVTQIYNNIGDSFVVSKIQGSSYKTYNNVYRINGIDVGNPKLIRVTSSSEITYDDEFFGSSPIVGVNTLGLAQLNPEIIANSEGYISGKSVGVTSLSYNNITGIASITTSDSHGYLVDNKVKIGGYSNNLYNGEFIVKKVNSVNSFNINIGIGTNVPSLSGTSYIYNIGIRAQGGFITIDNERSSGRLTYEYAGITTSLQVSLTSPSTNNITVSNALNLNLEVGDYLIINNEIMRVSGTVTSNTTINVFRGLFGSSKQIHSAGSVVKRVRFNPIEFRRNSILRASGHTFEYLGFGPGNYSTALPERQDRQFSDTERILSQAVSDDGGAPIYTGMDDKGNNYTVNVITNSSTGQNLVTKTPVPTVRGEDLTSNSNSVGYDILSTSEITVSRGIKVDGGDSTNIISEFNGPVIFNNKVSSNAVEGIESNSLYLQGDATISRRYTVGIATPTLSGNTGDAAFYSDPNPGETFGWVYARDNVWREFGPIKDSLGRYVGIFSGILIGDGSGLTNVSDIWVFDGVGISTTLSVGVGTTTARSGISLYAGGPVLFEGTTTFTTPQLNFNVPNGFLINTGITTFNQQLNANTFRAIGVSTFRGPLIVTTNSETTGNAEANYLKFVQTDTVINSSYNYGSILWEGNDVGNSGVRGYIRGVSEGTTGQFGITFGTQGSGSSNPQENLRIASDGVITTTNDIVCGNNITAVGEVTANSDIRIKTNIKTLENALDKVLQLRGVEYDRIDINKHQIGVIAQEVEKVLPDLVVDGDKKSVAYGNITAVLIEAIKEQQKQIEMQGKQIEDLLKKIGG